MTRLILITAIILCCVGCERLKANYAGIEEPSDKPKYTVPVKE